jgi:hypothetical protein
VEAMVLSAGSQYPVSVAWDLKMSPTRWSSSEPGAATVAPVVPPPPAEGEEPRPDMKTEAIITAVESGSPAMRATEIRAHATVDDADSEFNGQELVAVFAVTVTPNVGGDLTVGEALPPPEPPPEAGHLPGVSVVKRYRRNGK